MMRAFAGAIVSCLATRDPRAQEPLAEMLK